MVLNILANADGTYSRYIMFGYFTIILRSLLKIVTDPSNNILILFIISLLARTWTPWVGCLYSLRQ